MSFRNVYLNQHRWSPQVAYYGAVLSALAYFPVLQWGEAFKAWSGCNSIGEETADSTFGSRIVKFNHEAGNGIAIQGTSNLAQWIGYMVRHGVSEVAGIAGSIFTPFAEYFTANLGKVDAFAAADVPTFACGHSLGGAMAMLFSQRWAVQQKPLAGTYVYGCPNIGNSVWADSVAHRHYALCDVNDTVPHLPPAGFSTTIRPGFGVPFIPLMYGPSNTVAVGENRERPNVSTLFLQFGIATVIAESVSTGAMAHSVNNYVDQCYSLLKPGWKVEAAGLTEIYNAQFGIGAQV